MVRRVANRSSVRCRSIGWKRTVVVAAVCVAPFLGCAASPGMDPGAPPTGDPATGTGGGSNLTCGHSSFPSSAALYQDISTAAVDSQSATIMGALDARNWGDAGDRQTLGIDFSFAVNC